MSELHLCGEGRFLYMSLLWWYELAQVNYEIVSLELLTSMFN